VCISGILVFVFADVGFHIGGDSGVNYLVMQVHYARVLSGKVIKHQKTPRCISIGTSDTTSLVKV